MTRGGNHVLLDIVCSLGQSTIITICAWEYFVVPRRVLSEALDKRYFPWAFRRAGVGTQSGLWHDRFPSRVHSHHAATSHSRNTRLERLKHH